MHLLFIYFSILMVCFFPYKNRPLLQNSLNKSNFRPSFIASNRYFNNQCAQQSVRKTEHNNCILLTIVFNKSSYLKNCYHCLKEFKPSFIENKLNGTICLPIQTQGTSLNWFLLLNLFLKKDLNYQRWLILNTDKRRHNRTMVISISNTYLQLIQNCYTSS